MPFSMSTSYRARHIWSDIAGNFFAKLELDRNCEFFLAWESRRDSKEKTRKGVEASFIARSGCCRIAADKPFGDFRKQFAAREIGEVLEASERNEGVFRQCRRF